MSQRIPMRHSEAARRVASHLASEWGMAAPADILTSEFVLGTIRLHLRASQRGGHLKTYELAGTRPANVPGSTLFDEVFVDTDELSELAEEVFSDYRSLMTSKQLLDPDAPALTWERLPEFITDYLRPWSGWAYFTINYDAHLANGAQIVTIDFRDDSMESVDDVVAWAMLDAAPPENRLSPSEIPSDAVDHLVSVLDTDVRHSLDGWETDTAPTDAEALAWTGSENIASLLDIHRIVVSSSDEERVSFEPVWGIVETAISEGLLPEALENDVRKLYRMMADCRDMALDDGEDIYEIVCRKLDKLLPAILAVVDPGQPQPALAALQASAAGADESEQLEAINAGMAGVVALAAPAAAQLPTPEPKPYGPKLAQAAEHHKGRIAASLKVYGSFFDTFAQIGQLRPIRAAMRAGTWVASTASLTLAQTVAAQTGVPIPEGDVRLAISAALSGVVLRWLYARNRRRNPDLPGLLQPGIEPEKPAPPQP